MAIFHVHAGGKHTHGGAADDGWRTILYSFADRPWFSHRAARRWERVAPWDQMRTALRLGRRREAWPHLRYLANPAAVLTVLRSYQRRADARRRGPLVSWPR